LLPPKLEAGSTHENALLPSTVAELKRLGIKIKEASFDAGFLRDKTEQLLDGVSVFIVGSSDNAGSRRTRRRLARYRVGAEGRISHLKREYSAGRPRLKGKQGARIWEGWSALAYNLDTVAKMKPPAKKNQPPPGEETIPVP
jgi:IS5 family transposase